MITEEEARELLGLNQDVPLTIEVVQEAWRKTARRTHPDLGGDNDSFIRAKAAYLKLMPVEKKPCPTCGRRLLVSIAFEGASVTTKRFCAVCGYKATNVTNPEALKKV